MTRSSFPDLKELPEGPWVVFGPDDDGEWFVESHPEGTTPTVICTEVESEAIARAIASILEMLAEINELEVRSEGYHASTITMAKEIDRLRALNAEMLEATYFICSLATEELEFAHVGTGAEVALRHIQKKARAILAKMESES